VNQLANSAVTGAVMSGSLMVLPLAAVKWKIAVLSSRVLEKPSIVTVRVFPERAIAAVEIAGTVGGMVMTTGTTFAGVRFTPAVVVTTSVMVTVPATVPL